MAQRGNQRRGRERGLRNRIPGFFAGLALLGAGLSTISLFVPQLDLSSERSGALAIWLAYFIDIQPNLGWIILQLLVAAALAARKRMAWTVMLIFLSLSVAADLSYIFFVDWEFTQAEGILDLGWAITATVTHAVVLGLLIWGRPAFWAKVRRGAFLAAAAAFFGALGVGLLLGWGLVSVFPGTIAAGNRLAWTVNWVVGFGLGGVEGAPPGLVVRLLGLLPTLALVVAFWVLVRARHGTAGLSEHDEAALRVLLEQYGNNDSLGYFATRRDKSAVFAEKAAICYRVESGVALASGDPIGDPDSWDAAITAWDKAIRPYGWVKAVIGASKQGAAAYHRHGMSVLALGDEAILETDEFSLRGPERTEVRQAVSRARRAGLTVRIRRHLELSAAELAEISQLADQWRGDETERGFSMALGRLGHPDDGDCLLVEAQLPQAGEQPLTVGVLTFVPWGGSGFSLDLMRRSPDAPNGTFELMVTELCQRGRELGISRISLNFAMFRSVFERGSQLGAGPVLRFWRAILVFLSRWWQLESLYKANLKYHPRWSARYLCFADTRFLPQIGVAVGIAEGFLKRGPSLWQRKGATGEVPSNAPSLDELVSTSTRELRRPEQVRNRIGKTEKLAASGIEAWPVAIPPSHTAAELQALEAGTPGQVAGRVLALRRFGGVSFAQLRDWSGDLQVVLERDLLAEQLTSFDKLVDLGDLVRFEGVMGTSRSGEISLLASSWRIEAKCLHPMPDKRRGILDPEARVRQRHLDIAVNPQARQRLRARSAVLHTLRASLIEQGYLEVETPILQQIHGGANARPFTTHINAYDLDLYLRIAPELYLKRLCVGGMDKIFELGRTFRNEGVDYSHNPEFTILEAYAAHEDYLTMMRLCQQLIQQAAIAVHGQCVVPHPSTGELADISGDWPVKTFYGAISEALEAAGGSAIDVDSSVEDLRAACDLVQVHWQPGWNQGELALELYEHLVEDRTERPTFYKDFPLEVSPLTRSHRSTPGVTERWDLVAWGVELGTAYSELTDPLEQRRRLTQQSELAAGGDLEAMELDEDFLTALEYGMPPTGGLGMGVDRVVMLLTGASIRETLPFPMARPR